MFLTRENGLQIVTEIKSTIGRDVNIMDRTGTIIASTDPQRIGQIHTIARQIVEQQLPVLEVTSSQDGPGMQPGINLPIQVNGRCEGVIGITGPPKMVRDFGTIVKKMTEIMLMGMQQQQQGILWDRARQLYLEEWLFAKTIDWPAFSVQGELLGIEIQKPWRVAILTFEAKSGALPVEFHIEQLLQMAQHYFTADRPVLCTIENHHILMLLGERSDSTLSVLKQFKKSAEEAYGLSINGGLSTCSTSPEDVRRCYSEANIAVRAAAKRREILEYNGRSLDFILHNLDDKLKTDVCQAVFSSIPEQERPELISCLDTYFRYNGNIEQASGCLHIHKNTFRYRMRKLADYTGYNLRWPKDASLLYIAMQFLDSIP